MKMGVVFEIADKKAVIMKNDGVFVTVEARPEWKEGDLVAVAAQSVPWRVVSCLAACLFLFCSIGAGMYFKQAALISIDINPSLEIGINRFDRVIHVTSYNEDGNEVASMAPIENRTLSEAMELLLAKDALGQYLDAEGAVTFSVQTDISGKEMALSDELYGVVEAAVKPQHQNMEVNCYIVNEKTLSDAHAHDVTAGKYVTLLALLEADPTIDISEYTHHSISEIQAQTEYCKKYHNENSGQAQTSGSRGCAENGHHSNCHHN